MLPVTENPVVLYLINHVLHSSLICFSSKSIFITSHNYKYGGGGGLCQCCCQSFHAFLWDSNLFFLIGRFPEILHILYNIISK
ncbi:hypothetical protein FKM82_023999 [Ascaphus truei]